MPNKRIDILRSAKNIFGRIGYHSTSIDQIAQMAGVSRQIFGQYFHSKESVLLETQRIIFKEIHKRITQKSDKNTDPILTALDALDTIWQTTRDLRNTAPFIVETLNLKGKEGVLSDSLQQFYQESTQLLEDGIRTVFAKKLYTLIIPPDRMAILIRILLSGLLVELAGAKTDEDISKIDQAYTDFRSLFQQFAMMELEWEFDETTDSVPLPW